MLEKIVYTLVVLTSISCLYLAWKVDQLYQFKPNPCPITQDKLVAVHINGNKVSCVYSIEPLKQKKKYTIDMWLD
jgi:hypothetical protein